MFYKKTTNSCFLYRRASCVFAIVVMQEESAELVYISTDPV